MRRHFVIRARNEDDKEWPVICDYHIGETEDVNVWARFVLAGLRKRFTIVETEFHHRD